MNYRDYLKSESWKRKKRQVVSCRGGKACWICQKKKVDVHHMTYKRIGQEDHTKDLVLVCRLHHFEIHRKAKEWGMNLWNATHHFKREYEKQHGRTFGKSDVANYWRESRKLQKQGL